MRAVELFHQLMSRIVLRKYIYIAKPFKKKVSVALKWRTVVTCYYDTSTKTSKLKTFKGAGRDRLVGVKVWVRVSGEWWSGAVSTIRCWKVSSGSHSHKNSQGKQNLVERKAYMCFKVRHTRLNFHWSGFIFLKMKTALVFISFFAGYTLLNGKFRMFKGEGGSQDRASQGSTLCII